MFAKLPRVFSCMGEHRFAITTSTPSLRRSVLGDGTFRTEVLCVVAFSSHFSTLSEVSQPRMVSPEYNTFKFNQVFGLRGSCGGSSVEDVGFSGSTEPVAAVDVATFWAAFP